MGCMLSLVQKDADLQELYNLSKMLGEGVEGEVWLATSKKTGAHTAVKLIPRGEDLGLGPDKVRREIQLQARLSHVNIVELKQVVLTPRHLGIVMTYEAGGDLHVFCSKFKVDEEAARYFFVQIIAALEYCHDHNIAHRDLKLSNFLLTGNDPPRLKLTDFGCAGDWKPKQAATAKMARFKTFAGTPAYMAPQVLESAFYPTNTYSAVEADVWACGILLCHIFFGRHTPFWLEPNALEPNAFRSEGATALERIRAMKGARGGWARSDPYIEAHAAALSPELRDLLDAIFVGDEDERITIQGIKAHPWFNGPLSPKLQASIDAMKEEQRRRDKTARAAVSAAAARHDLSSIDAMREEQTRRYKTARAAVSAAAARHDLVDANTGTYATIDEMVRLATKWRRMPANDRVVVLEMAHIDLDAAAATATAGADASLHASSGLPTPSAAAGRSRDSSRRGPPSREASRRGMGDRGGGGGGEAVEPCGAAGMVRTLSLQHHEGGLTTASYSLEPSAHGGGAFFAGGGGGAGSGGDASAHSAGARSAPGGPRSRGGSAHGGSAWFEGSAHGGNELFRRAAEAASSSGGGGAARQEQSWHAGQLNAPPPPAGGGGGGGAGYNPSLDRSLRNGGGTVSTLSELDEDV
ncbi:MAG: kinase-like domain-containing protein [Monoraphidium minutum]|nr:MAG: kinase-like domain-containing protein [Monoraphidium minutum]